MLKANEECNDFGRMHLFADYNRKQNTHYIKYFLSYVTEAQKEVYFQKICCRRFQLSGFDMLKIPAKAMSLAMT